MKIGIDIQSTLGPKTGIGYYTRNLIEQFGGVKDFRFSYYRDSGKADLNTLERIRWENLGILRLARKGQIDILHIPGFAGPITRGRYKRVTTVHDLIGVIYPENLAPVSRFYWQRWLPACVRNSDLIIADSQNSKKDIIELLNIPAERIKVIYLAADGRFKPIDKSEDQSRILKDYGIDKRFILNVGTVEPRKNIVALIGAWGEYLKESGRDDILLVIAGKKGWDYQRCLQKCEQLHLNDKVKFLDYVRDEDLPILYNLAEVFVYPSFYEGFGLPVLEAMSCGAPIICSGASSLPEITDRAACLVNPNSLVSIKSALRAVLEDRGLRLRLSKDSVVQSRRFSWGKTATDTINVYKEVLS